MNGMLTVLMFFCGAMVGGVIGVVMMCFMQINRSEENRE